LISRRSGPDGGIFACHDHRYEIRPPASPKILDRVESLAGVRLPEEYREFVTTVGDGAPGPYYGIMPLTRS
jgi:hypothetical protein